MTLIIDLPLGSELVVSTGSPDPLKFSAIIVELGIREINYRGRCQNRVVVKVTSDYK